MSILSSVQLLKPAAQHIVFAFNHAQPIYDIQNDCNAGEVYSEVTAKALDDPKPRHDRNVEQGTWTYALYRFYQTDFDELLDKLWMNVGTGRKRIHRQLAPRVPA
jgi:hypothetical protein